MGQYGLHSDATPKSDMVSVFPSQEFKIISPRLDRVQDIDSAIQEFRNHLLHFSAGMNEDQNRWIDSFCRIHVPAHLRFEKVSIDILREHQIPLCDDIVSQTDDIHPHAGKQGCLLYADIGDPGYYRLHHIDIQI